MTQLCLLLLAAVVLVFTPSRLLLLLLLVAVVVVVVGRTDDLLTMHLDFPYFNRFMFSNISRSMDSSRNEKQESCCWDDEECDNLFTATTLYQQCTISVRKCSMYKVQLPGSSSAELRPGSQSVHRHQHSGAGALPDIGHSVNNV